MNGTHDVDVEAGKEKVGNAVVAAVSMIVGSEEKARDIQTDVKNGVTTRANAAWDVLRMIDARNDPREGLAVDTVLRAWFFFTLVYLTISLFL